MILPTFDVEAHTYMLAGKNIPSVTGILKAAGLVDTRWFTEYARERGTAVHAAVLFDDESDLNEAVLDPVLRLFLQQWRTFKKLTRAVVINSEQIVYSWSQDYAGTYDKLLLLHGRRTLIDIKTGHAPKWVIAQLGGYSFAAAECGIQHQDLACVALTKVGFSVVHYDIATARAEWVSALNKARKT